MPAGGPGARRAPSPGVRTPRARRPRAGRGRVGRLGSGRGSRAFHPRPPRSGGGGGGRAPQHPGRAWRGLGRAATAGLRARGPWSPRRRRGWDAQRGSLPWCAGRAQRARGAGAGRARAGEGGGAGLWSPECDPGSPSRGGRLGRGLLSLPRIALRTRCGVRRGGAPPLGLRVRGPREAPAQFSLQGPLPHSRPPALQSPQRSPGQAWF